VRALVVEDDPVVGPDLAKALAASGFVVDLARDGEDASFKGGVEDYAVAILDLGLPRLDGLSVLRRWRADGRAFPVLILSARGDWTEKVEGIEAGADDYLAKPFEMGELLARTRGLVRRAAGRVSPVIEAGRLILDTRRMSAALDGAPLRLSPLEFRLLDCLAHNPGRAVSAGELAEQLYGVADTADTNAIEALVTRLRRKVGADVIETRRGFGYLLAHGTS
jgi:DNA-binding response OmpR family regulator